MPSTVRAPPVIHPAPVALAAATGSSLDHILRPSEEVSQLQQRNAHPVCPLSVQLLQQFRERIDSLSESVGEAGDDHELAQFAGDTSALEDQGADVWETWDPILNRLLQRSKQELRNLVKRGERGLIGLHRLFEHLVVEHGIVGSLIEGKLQRLMDAMDDV
jgi:hypothetical protein